MSDRRLQVFYTVAKLLSFTKAAETLHMTQPAVTFQVRQLEDHFNTRLFDRTHNKILLTDAGQKVFFYAEKIFDLNTEMEHSLRALAEDTSGTLSIGGSAMAALRNYSIASSINTVERTVMGDTSRSFKSNLKEWSGSADIYYDVTDVGIIQSAIDAGVEVALAYPGGSTAGSADPKLAGNILITGLSVDSSMDGMVTSAISFQGTGDLLIASD